MYVHGGIGSTIRNNTLAKLQWQRKHVARSSDGKVWIELVTSTCTMSCNELLHDNTRHTRTLPLLT
jgi:hypothetical protein